MSSRPPWPPAQPDWLDAALHIAAGLAGCGFALAIYGFAQWLAGQWNPFL